MRLSHTTEYYAVILFARIVCLVPLRLALRLGTATGALAWALGVRRDLVLSNIARARPDASDAELRRIGKQAARNIGRTIVEFMRYGIKDRDAIHRLIKIDGIDRIQDGLAQGKGALLLTGHFGSWALYFAAIALRGVPLSLLVGKQHNERIDDFILRIPGDKVEFISKGRAAVKKIIQKLGEGRAIVIAADQHAGRSGVPVPFLGRTTPTLSLPGAFAVKHGCPVFMMDGHRNEDGTHQVQIRELVVPERETPEEQKVEVLKRYNEEMGKIISERPEQYFWYHRRWRDEDES